MRASKREARAIAALNHPNICTLYDIGPNYLVMELVEGETLAGPLPPAEVLRIGRQIGEALMAAHDANIVHRDLKPANVKIRPDGLVKVLDFGLASLVAPDPIEPNEAPTIASPTAAGVIVGSPSWMSPEQARGRKTDKRTDIWAFGVVLYEISTGERLFTGETLSDTIAQVLTKEPDLSRLPAELKPLVSWCLEKDPSKRLRDIADARPWLDPGSLPVKKTEAAAVSTSPRRNRPWWPLATAAALLAAVGIGAVHFREKPAPPPEIMRFQIRLPEGVKIEPSGALSLAPDGRHIAFPGVTSEGNRILVQDLDGGVARALTNARIGSASPPFFWKKS
jgi:serine/threonine protein kinase